MKLPFGYEIHKKQNQKKQFGISGRSRIETGKKGKKSGREMFAQGFARDRSRLKQYWNYYQQENTVFASINVTAYNICMTGYNIYGEDEKSSP